MSEFKLYHMLVLLCYSIFTFYVCNSFVCDHSSKDNFFKLVLFSSLYFQPPFTGRITEKLVTAGFGGFSNVISSTDMGH